MKENKSDQIPPLLEADHNAAQDPPSTTQDNEEDTTRDKSSAASSQKANQRTTNPRTAAQEWPVIKTTVEPDSTNWHPALTQGSNVKRPPGPHKGS